MRNALLPVGHHDEVMREVSPDEFETCARRVPGWDLLIVLQSYSSGRDVLDHPALARRPSDLRDEVQRVDGFMNEGVRTVLVIRGDHIVERFQLTMSLRPDVGDLVLSRDG